MSPHRIYLSVTPETYFSRFRGITKCATGGEKTGSIQDEIGQNPNRAVLHRSRIWTPASWSQKTLFQHAQVSSVHQQYGAKNMDSRFSGSLAIRVGPGKRKTQGQPLSCSDTDTSLTCHCAGFKRFSRVARGLNRGADDGEAQDNLSSAELSSAVPVDEFRRTR